HLAAHAPGPRAADRASASPGCTTRGNMTRETGTGKYEQALTKTRHLDPIPTAVAHPCDETSLAGAFEAMANRLIIPILVGPEKKIRDVAQRHGIDLGKTRLVDARHRDR